MTIKVSQETVNGITNNRFVLSANGIMRQMGIGSNWTKLRIAMALNTTGSTAITGTPRLYFGICQGTSNGVLSSNTDAFIGVRTNDSEFGTGPLHDCRSWNAITKQGASTSVYATSSLGVELASLDAPEDYTNALILDFNKVNATTMGVTLWGQYILGAHNHITGEVVQLICNSGGDPDTAIPGASDYRSAVFPNATVPDVDVYDSIQIATNFSEEFQISSIAYGRIQ